jgi:predicted nucleic acid-binding protein
MTGRVFVDTNILLYAEFDDGSEKHHAAKKLLLQEILGAEVFISAQVLSEFYVQAMRKGKTAEDIEAVLQQYADKFNILPLDLRLIKNAWRIKKQYQFSYWDSLIVAASLSSGCDILYSEDLQDRQIIENSLRIINPVFIKPIADCDAVSTLIQP